MNLLPPNPKPVPMDIVAKIILQTAAWTAIVFMYLVIVVYVPPVFIALQP